MCLCLFSLLVSFCFNQVLLLDQKWIRFVVIILGVSDVSLFLVLESLLWHWYVQIPPVPSVIPSFFVQSKINNGLFFFVVIGISEHCCFPSISPFASVFFQTLSSCCLRLCILLLMCISVLGRLILNSMLIIPVSYRL